MTAAHRTKWWEIIYILPLLPITIFISALIGITSGLISLCAWYTSIIRQDDLMNHYEKWFDAIENAHKGLDR